MKRLRLAPLAILMAGLLFAAACGAETVVETVIVEKVVPGEKVVETVIVEKVVPGEKVVETVIVEKAVPGEKVVETVVVEKVVPGEKVIQTVVVEKMVVATPTPARAGVFPIPGTTLRIAFGSFGTGHLDPALNDGVSNAQLLLHVFDSLTEEVPGGRAPGLAEEWSVSPDGMEYTFKIRDNAYFHRNWGRVTAEDIAFCLERRLRGPLVGNRPEMFEDVVVVDGRTLRIKVAEPAVSFLFTFDTIFRTMSKDWLLQDVGDVDLRSLSLEELEAEISRQTEFISTNLPVASGPFALESRVLGDSITYAAMEEHWRNVPAFERMEAFLVPEVATQQAMIRSGEVDMIQTTAETAADLEAVGVEIVSVPNSIGIGMMFTGTFREVAQDKPTANPMVRKALILALDRPTLREAFAGEYGGPPAGPWGTTSSTANVDGDFWEKWYKDNMPYDPELAKQMLVDEGYAGGFKDDFKLFSFPRGNAPFLQQMAEVVVAYWSEIGVTPEIYPLDYGAYRPHLVRVADENDPFNAADAAPMTAGMLADPNQVMYNWFHSEGGLRLSNDETFDRLQEQMDLAFDPEERTRIVTEAGLRLINQWTMVPLFNTDTLWAMNPDRIDPESWAPTPGRTGMARVYEKLRPK